MGPNQGTFSVPGTEEMVKYPARLQNCYEPVSIMCFLFYTFKIEVSIVAVMSFPHYCLMGVYRADNDFGGGVSFFSSQVLLRSLRSSPHLHLALVYGR